MSHLLFCFLSCYNTLSWQVSFVLPPYHVTFLYSTPPHLPYQHSTITHTVNFTLCHLTQLPLPIPIILSPILSYHLLSLLLCTNPYFTLSSSPPDYTLLSYTLWWFEQHNYLGSCAMARKYWGVLLLWYSNHQYISCPRTGVEINSRPSIPSGKWALISLIFCTCSAVFVHVLGKW